MICGACELGMDVCLCADADDRLRGLAFSPGGHIIFAWCRACNKARMRCRCIKPNVYLVCGGQEVDPEQIGYPGIPPKA